MTFAAGDIAATAAGAALFLAVAGAAFAGMEAVAWASHRFLMHGPLWFLHRSHHLPRGPLSGRGRLEANDWFGVAFSLPAMALIAWGVAGRPLLAAAGLGMTAYGAGYILLHDALVHGRFGRLPPPRHPYLRRLVQAHRLHHARQSKHGCRAFGFLLAPPRRPVKAPG